MEWAETVLVVCDLWMVQVLLWLVYILVKVYFRGSHLVMTKIQQIAQSPRLKVDG